MTEVDEKVERVARFAHAQGLEGVLLSRQPNFSWLTAGQSNRIDGSAEGGAGALLTTARGDRYLIANNIEMPRLSGEALRDFGFEPVEYPWAADHRDPAMPLKTALRVVRGDIGVDATAPGALDVAALLPSLQTPLTDQELRRYRVLGRETASALEQLCRSLRPGSTESAIAGEVNSVVALTGARAIVTLVAADERIAAFRHPLPTERAWTSHLLIGLCAERHGLVVALSRIIAASDVASLVRPTEAAASVFAAMLAATLPGVTGAQLFATAANAYRNVGHQGQETSHHQGGAIGYRSRDWLAHSGSADVVQNRQAFAWNPSITGTKVEDTAVLVDGAMEVITATGEWPAIDVAAGDQHYRAPGILEL